MGPGQDFYGRHKELRHLKAQYERPSSLTVLYGRRRVGKTRLIIHSLEGQPALYFAATQAPAPVQRQRFMEAVARYLDDPLLARLPVSGWGEALDVLDRRRQGKLILAFDELQWAVEADPELPSVLQHLWDGRWEGRGGHLILCGSYLGFMEREVLGGRQPLFGRRTSQLLLRPFPVAEVGAQLPSLGQRHLLSLYLILGGIPTYLNEVRASESLRGAVCRLLLEDTAPLREEPLFLLREELSDFRYHNAVLAAIAGGATMATEIAAGSGIPVTGLRYYLEPLLDLGYLSRQVSLERQGQPRSTKSRYAISDPLLRFWFRFVFPHASPLALEGGRAVWDHLIAPHLDAFLGHAFEELVREALPGWILRQEGAVCQAVGRFWNRHAEIDAVAVREDGLTHLVEVKWRREKVGLGHLATLREKLPQWPNPAGHTLVPTFVSLGGYSEELLRREDVRCIPVAELLGLTAGAEEA